MTDLSPRQFEHDRFDREASYMNKQNYSISDSNGDGEDPSWRSIASFHDKEAQEYAPVPGILTGHPGMMQAHQRLAQQARGLHAKQAIMGSGPTQEEYAGQRHLPGMDRFDVADLHPANSALPKDHPDYVPSQKEWAGQQADYARHRKIRDAAGPVKDRWSGPDTGQMIMGVRNLHENNGQFDPHGFVHEPSSNEHWAEDTARRVGEGFQTADPGNSVDAKQYYRSVGGAHADQADVKRHWASQPVKDVPSDAVIHTGQYWDEETEQGNPISPSIHAPEGRARINSIRNSMEKDGFRPERAAWLMKHNDRLYALDGHHRIVAAREAGLQSFPARIWDRDAEQKSVTAEALHPAQQAMPHRVPGMDIGQQFANVVARHANR